MKLPLQTLSIRKKLFFLPVLFFFAMIALQSLNLFLQGRILNEVVSVNLGDQMMSGHKNLLKATVDIQATTLAIRVKGLATREEKIAAIIAETDPVRFFDDKSGYFFTYDFNGVRINVPTNKSGNGKNLIDLADGNGYRFIEGLVNAAKKGGGFVEYHFMKEGHGVQPKMSYAAPIPGTDFFVGAGVYTDDIAQEKMRLQASVDARNRGYLLYLLVFFGAIMVVLLGLSYLISHSINKSITRATDELRTSSHELSAASGLVASTSQNLAKGASDQAASLEETSSALETMAQMIHSNVGRLQQVKQFGAQARVAAEKGEGDMAALGQAMNAIKSSSDEISKITKTIDEIAFQTNILALNAAVEAARAGEAGAGFAVVAEEVRSLAQRSAQAAKDTTAKIQGAISTIAQGVGINERVATELKEITAKTRQVDELSAEVLTASQEQNRGITEVNTAVFEMNKVTQSTAASAEEGAAAAEEVNAQADSLEKTVVDLEALVGKRRAGASE